MQRVAGFFAVFSAGSQCEPCTRARFIHLSFRSFFTGGGTSFWPMMYAACVSLPTLSRRCARTDFLGFIVISCPSFGLTYIVYPFARRPGCAVFFHDGYGCRRHGEDLARSLVYVHGLSHNYIHITNPPVVATRPPPDTQRVTAARPRPRPGMTQDLSLPAARSYE